MVKRDSRLILVEEEAFLDEVVGMMFSVIIPVYNRAHLIPQAIDSVLNQAGDDCEVIVVDDGSEDHPELAAEKKDSRLRWIRQERAGLGSARNRGLREARGKYVGFLDSDDVWLEGALEAFRQAIKQGEAPAFVSGQWFEVPMEREKDFGFKPQSFEAKVYPDYLATASLGWLVGTPGVMVKKEWLIQVKGFETGVRVAEDLDLWLRLGHAPKFVAIQSPKVFLYRRHSTSTRSDEKELARGVYSMIEREKRGVYPGGRSRQRDRRTLITQSSRAASFFCLEQGAWALGFGLYRKTLRWHLALGSFRYVAGFPLYACFKRSVARLKVFGTRLGFGGQSLTS